MLQEYQEKPKPPREMVAVRYTEANKLAVIDWITADGRRVQLCGTHGNMHIKCPDPLICWVEEGTESARFGDWIIYEPAYHPEFSVLRDEEFHKQWDLKIPTETKQENSK